MSVTLLLFGSWAGSMVICHRIGGRTGQDTLGLALAVLFGIFAVPLVLALNASSDVQHLSCRAAERWVVLE